MILKYTKLNFLVLISGLLCFACKKEIAMENTRFGILNLKNQTTQKDLLISYNEVPLLKNIVSEKYDNIKVPEGTGKLAFKDATGKLLLETTFHIDAYKTKDLILFQPVADLKPVILDNNQAGEPKPKPGFIKIRATSFTVHVFKNPIDMVFYYDDPVTGDKIEIGTLTNIPSEFKDYQEFKFPGNLAIADQFSIMIVDSATKEPLLDWYTYVTAIPSKSVYTFYIKESPDGAGVLGTPYFVSTETLFAD